MMNQHNDDSRPPDGSPASPEAQSLVNELKPEAGGEPSAWPSENAGQLPGSEMATYPAEKSYPEDLQISWSWPHFVVFIIFVLSLLAAVPLAMLAMNAPHQRMTEEQLQQYMLSKPQVAIGGTILVYGLILFFLYVSLALLPGQPFWSTVGWRKIRPIADGISVRPVVYALTGSGLSLFVVALTNFIKRPENIPIDELFKYRQTALLFVAMAVLVAPLAEETVFRGYLYPMFARWFGVTPSIVITGVLFGLMHGPQLGEAKSLIAVMSLVGIVFTLVRARTGSVMASFLMHLGYNSLIGVTLLLATHGFTQMPAGK